MVVSKKFAKTLDGTIVEREDEYVDSSCGFSPAVNPDRSQKSEYL
jgi:hypothetical protein